MNNFFKFLKNKSSEFFRIFLSFGVALGLVILLGRVYELTHAVSSLSEPTPTQISIDTLNKKIAELQNKVILLIGNKGMTDTLVKIINNTKAISDAALRLKIYQYEKNQMYLAKRQDALNQAFNPTKVEDVITIARLKDAVNDLTNNEKNLDQALNQRQGAFEDNVNRQVSTMTNLTFTIVVAVLTVIIFPFFNSWRDKKRSDSSTL